MPLAAPDPDDIGASFGHAHCLLCGALNPSSLKLRFRLESGGCVLGTFKVGETHQGYEGVLHGGVIAAFMDAAMAHCLFHGGIRALTGDLHIRYCAPAYCGESLEIRSRISFSKPPLYRLRAELCAPDRQIAWAEAKFVRQKAPFSVNASVGDCGTAEG